MFILPIVICQFCIQSLNNLSILCFHTKFAPEFQLCTQNTPLALIFPIAFQNNRRRIKIDVRDPAMYRSISIFFQQKRKSHYYILAAQKAEVSYEQNKSLPCRLVFLKESSVRSACQASPSMFQHRNAWHDQSSGKAGK